MSSSSATDKAHKLSHHKLKPKYGPQSSAARRARPRRMRTVSRDDELLIRGANPRTGFISPWKTGSLEDDYFEKQPEIAPANGQGKWTQGENGWSLIETAEVLFSSDSDHVTPHLPPGPTIDHEKIAKYQRGMENATGPKGNNGFVDLFSPPSPPDSSADTLSSAMTILQRIKRKPVGSGVARREPSTDTVLIHKLHGQDSRQPSREHRVQIVTPKRSNSPENIRPNQEIPNREDPFLDRQMEPQTLGSNLQNHCYQHKVQIHQASTQDSHRAIRPGIHFLGPYEVSSAHQTSPVIHQNCGTSSGNRKYQLRRHPQLSPTKETQTTYRRPIHLCPPHVVNQETLHIRKRPRVVPRPVVQIHQEHHQEVHRENHQEDLHYGRQRQTQEDMDAMDAHITTITTTSGAERPNAHAHSQLRWRNNSNHIQDHQQDQPEVNSHGPRACGHPIFPPCQLQATQGNVQKQHVLPRPFQTHSMGDKQHTPQTTPDKTRKHVQINHPTIRIHPCEDDLPIPQHSHRSSLQILTPKCSPLSSPRTSPPKDKSPPLKSPNHRYLSLETLTTSPKHRHLSPETSMSPSHRRSSPEAPTSPTKSKTPSPTIRSSPPTVIRTTMRTNPPPASPKKFRIKPSIIHRSRSPPADPIPTSNHSSPAANAGATAMRSHRMISGGVSRMRPRRESETYNGWVVTFPAEEESPVQSEGGMTDLEEMGAMRLGMRGGIDIGGIRGEKDTREERNMRQEMQQIHSGREKVFSCPGRFGSAVEESTMTGMLDGVNDCTTTTDTLESTSEEGEELAMGGVSRSRRNSTLPILQSPRKGTDFRGGIGDSRGGKGRLKTEDQSLTRTSSLLCRLNEVRTAWSLPPNLTLSTLLSHTFSNIQIGTKTLLEMLLHVLVTLSPASPVLGVLNDQNAKPGEYQKAWRDLGLAIGYLLMFLYLGIGFWRVCSAVEVLGRVVMAPFKLVWGVLRWWHCLVFC